MNYDQLLNLAENLLKKRNELIKKGLEQGIDKYQKEYVPLINKLDSEYRPLKYRIKGLVYANYNLTRNRTSTEEFKAWKKAFKHEFLTEAKDGYGIRDIMLYISYNIKNPGINPIYYVRALRNTGYFAYQDIKDNNSKLILSSKALRYLENEANIRLRR